MSDPFTIRIFVPDGDPAHDVFAVARAALEAREESRATDCGGDRAAEDHCQAARRRAPLRRDNHARLRLDEDRQRRSRRGH